MRNVFDQYSQPENRLTHALVSSLAADRRLLRRFVRWVTNSSGKIPRDLEIVEQRLPGEVEAGDEEEDEVERLGLPDAWIHDGEPGRSSWRARSKRPLKRASLIGTAAQPNDGRFSDINLIAFVPQRPPGPAPNKVRIIEWTELYAWMRGEEASEWARRLTDYMEVLEKQKLAYEEYLKEGTITVFTGISFGQDNPYNYHEAKRLLRLALGALRARRDLRRDLGMDPSGEAEGPLPDETVPRYGISSRWWTRARRRASRNSRI